MNAFPTNSLLHFPFNNPTNNNFSISLFMPITLYSFIDRGNYIKNRFLCQAGSGFSTENALVCQSLRRLPPKRTSRRTSWASAAAVAAT